LKNKKNLRLCIIVFLLLLGSKIYTQEIPQLKVTFEPDTRIFLENCEKLPLSLLSMKGITKNLKERYKEVWESDKSKWPECIKKVFENLKDFPTIELTWALEPQFQNPLYQGNLDAKGFFTELFFMEIRNVYAERFKVTPGKIAELNLDKTRVNTDMWFNTSAAFLHEMIHMALLYNQGTQAVKNEDGHVVDSYAYEPKVEDCTSLVFGNGIRYYDLQGLNPEKDIPDDCDCKNHEGQHGGKRHGISLGNPGNDHGDDSFSSAGGSITQNNLDSNAIIYMNGYFEELNALIGGVFFEGAESPQKLLEISPVIVIPSGGFFGKEHDSSLKIVLSEYVRLGGNIVVLAQQANEHFSVLPGCLGTPLTAFGWASDQSCYSASTYYKNIHPCVSAFQGWNGVGSINTDGYFEEFNENCISLLRRTKNHKPLAMIYYPFEDINSGAILVSSMFTDWGAAHGQANITERRILRDFITYMKNARKEVPLIDLSQTPNPTLQLNINIKNTTNESAAKVKLSVYNPDRTKLAYSVDKEISLSPSEAITIPISFSLNNYYNIDYGISHVDYDLYDVEDNVILMASESDGGRFAVYHGENSYIPKDKYSTWITSASESYYWNQQPEITLHIRSYSEESITVNWRYQWGHGTSTPLPALTVPAGGESTYVLNPSFPDYTSRYIESRTHFNLLYKLSTDSNYASTQKGFFVKGNPTTSNIKIDNESISLKSNSPVNYTINSRIRNEIDTATLPDVEHILRVSLLDSSGNLVEVVDEKTHNFKWENTYSFTGTYIPSTRIPSGTYRLQLEVFYPDMGSEIKTAHFYYNTSKTWVRFESIDNTSRGYLLLGKQYPIR